MKITFKQVNLLSTISTLLCLSVIITSDLLPEENWKTNLGNYQRNGSKNGNLTGPLTKLWEIDLGRGIKSSPTVVDDIILIAVPDRRLFALNRHTGKQIWKKKFGSGFESSPTVWNNKIIIPSLFPDGKLFFIDLLTGDKLMDVSIGDSSCTPTIANGTIYVGTNSGSMFALNAEDGVKIWARRLDGEIDSSPVVVDSLIYITAHDKNLYCLHTATGNQIHKVDLEDNVWRDLSFNNDHLFLATTTGIVKAYSNASLRQIWENDFEAPIFSSVAVYNSMLYFTTQDRFLNCFDFEKKEIAWRVSLPDIAPATPVTTGKFVLVGTLSGILKLIEAETGLTIWQEKLKSSISSSPIIVDNKVYVVTELGTVYCFKSGY